MCPNTWNESNIEHWILNEVYIWCCQEHSGLILSIEKKQNLTWFKTSLMKNKIDMSLTRDKHLLKKKIIYENKNLIKLNILRRSLNFAYFIFPLSSLVSMHRHFKLRTHPATEVRWYTWVAQRYMLQHKFLCVAILFSTFVHFYYRKVSKYPFISWFSSIQWICHQLLRYKDFMYQREKTWN